MSTSRRFRALKLGLALLLSMVVYPYCRANADVPLPPPEQIFGSYGLAIDDASLLAYLRDGLPETFDINQHSGSGLMNCRWSFYPLAMELLERHRASSAVEILAGQLNAPLNSRLAADLKEYAGRLGGAQEDNVQYFLYFHRAGCAKHMGEIGNPAAVEPLLQFVREHMTVLKEAVGERLYPAYACAFGEACTALARLGHKEGVEFIIQALPDVPLDDTWATTKLLIITGQAFGPEPGHPARVAAAAREKWLAWWRVNRDSFSIDPSSIPRRRTRPFAPNGPMAMRDYLRAAKYRDMIPPPDSYDPKAVAWLEKNGPEKVDELAAVVNNPDEAYDIRFESMEWYLRFGGKKALRNVARYARGEVPFDPADAYMKDFLQRNSMALIEKTSPKFAKSLSRQANKKN